MAVDIPVQLDRPLRRGGLRFLALLVAGGRRAVLPALATGSALLRTAYLAGPLPGADWSCTGCAHRSVSNPFSARGALHVYHLPHGCAGARGRGGLPGSD